MSKSENNVDVVEKALRKAFQLGQAYWMQADSEYAHQWKKADETEAKFEMLIQETLSEITKE